MAPSRMASTVTRERDCCGGFLAVLRDRVFFIPNLKGRRVAELRVNAAYCATRFVQHPRLETEVGSRENDRIGRHIMPQPTPKLTDHVSFKKDGLAARYAQRRIPMATLYEAYFDGDLDIPGDIYQLLQERQSLVSYRIERRHLEWVATNFLPE